MKNLRLTAEVSLGDALLLGIVGGAAVGTGMVLGTYITNIGLDHLEKRKASKEDNSNSYIKAVMD